MPLFNSEMLPDPFDITSGGLSTELSIADIVLENALHQVPSSVFLDTRAPGKDEAVSHKRYSGEAYVVPTYGVDFPDPR